MEGGGESTQPHLLFHLAHVPLKFSPLLETVVSAHKFVEDGADFRELLPKGLRVELEGVVHDAAIVEGEYLQVGR